MKVTIVITNREIFYLENSDYLARVTSLFQRCVHLPFFNLPCFPSTDNSGLR